MVHSILSFLFNIFSWTPNQYGDQRSIWSLPFYTTSVVGPSRQYVDLRSIMVRTILYFTFNICSWTPSSVCWPEKHMVPTILYFTFNICSWTLNQYGDQRSIWSLPFYTTSVVGPSRQYADLRSIMVRTILYFTFNICSWTPSSVCGPEKQAQMVSTTLSIDLWDGLLNKNK